MKKGWMIVLPGLCLGTYVQSNGIVSDDHGDTPAAATFLNFSAALDAHIDIRNDRDIFCFDADSYAAFLVRVTPINGVLGVKEAELRLYDPDGFTRLAKATSTGNRPYAEVNFVNTGINRRIYIDVRSFSEYTTGDYRVQVDRVADAVDSDGDGLPDDWEVKHSFNPNSPVGEHGASGNPDADNLGNLEEFLAGTDPRDGSSAILLTDSTGPVAGGRITWTAVPYGTYRVFRSPVLANPTWTALATVSHVGTASTASYTDPATLSSGSSYLYRVEFIGQ